MNIYEIYRSGGAKPIDADAAAAMTDREYYDGMVKYGQDYGRLCAPIWQEQYLMSGDKPKESIARTA